MNLALNNQQCLICHKTNYFYFSAFRLEMKANEILEYILLFSRKRKTRSGTIDQLPNFRKISIRKIVLACAMEMEFELAYFETANPARKPH